VTLNRQGQEKTFWVFTCVVRYPRNTARSGWMTEFQNVPPTFGQRCRRILLEVFQDLIQTIARWLKENQMTPSQVFEILLNRLLYVW
jgi:hypothetical protein